eukprot:5280452-Prymnesium_polylepis.1
MQRRPGQTSSLRHAAGPRLEIPQRTHDAVRDDHIEARVGQAAGGEVLDHTVLELRVGLRVPELLRVPLALLLRDVDLRGRHVHADHAAFLAHELAEQVAVAAGTATEVEHR